jgi:Histidine kinase/Histidine kinase-, DNA gyrase B-, and HSP90-like ATPase
MTALELRASGELAIARRLFDAVCALLFLLVSLVVGIGDLVLLPIAAIAGPAAVRRMLESERALVNRLLCARVPAPPPLAPEARLSRAQLAFLAGKLPISLAAAILCGIPTALFVELVAHSIEGLTASGSAYVGPWLLGPVVGLVLLILAMPALMLSVGALEAAAGLISQVSRRGLSSPSGAVVPVREALAERLGDRTLAIAYWLPERQLFVDERGHPVTLPEPGSSKAWTAVAHHGSRVAAIIHDAELQARPEFVEAAAAGAVLALDNERLKAELNARLEELRASRRRIVEATVEARRRLERDLHDGAQQRLVSMSLDLQLLRGRVGGEPALELLDSAITTLGEAQTELRELARGIHPPMLSDRGLGPALDALAQRSAVPVELDLRVAERLAKEVETGSYFVAVEALTNVAKYAQATHASLSVSEADGVLTLEVSDDGVGGADPDRGSGLRGLSDRVAALDGELTVDSPPGRGTRVTARIPCTKAGT